MKQLCRSVFSLLLLAAVCAACNLLAAVIDTPALRENAADGCQLLCCEGATPELAGGFRSSQADNFTAVLILKTAAYTGGETPLQRAFGGFRKRRRYESYLQSVGNHGSTQHCPSRGFFQNLSSYFGMLPVRSKGGRTCHYNQ